MIQPLGDVSRGVAAARFDSTVASVRPVKIGNNRHVKLDMTTTVKGWLANPSTNHGIVIGTLTGPPTGNASLKESGLGSGVTIRVTYFYDNRTGGQH